MKAVIIIFSILLVALLVALLVVILIFLKQKKKITRYEEELEIKTRAYNNLMKNYLNIKDSEKFKHEKEKETNEKIDDLHSDKLSADDILPKR
jgi:biopolymer transport protein ExbB/TolQ